MEWFSDIFTGIHTYVHTCITISTAGLNGIIGGHCSKGVKSAMFSRIETFLFSAALDKEKLQLLWLISRGKKSTNLNNFKTYCTCFFGPN